MTTSLATAIEMSRRDLRDPEDAGATPPIVPAFTDDELTDLWVAGIAELAQFYPKEVIVDLALSAFTTYRATLPEEIEQVFRVELYDADGTFREDIPESPNDQGAGWQVHADTLFIPPRTYATGATLKLWGYGPWVNFDWPSGPDVDQSWFDYEPTWNGGAGDPGDGTLTGKYHPTVHAAGDVTMDVLVQLVMGADATVPSDPWYFSRPDVGWTYGDTTIGGGFIQQTDTYTEHPLAVKAPLGASLWVYIDDGEPVTDLVPVEMVEGDILNLQIRMHQFYNGGT